MRSGWTGGQYSIARAVFAVGLGAALLQAPAFGDRVLGLIAAFMLAIGWLDRWAALVMAALWVMRIAPPVMRIAPPPAMDDAIVPLLLILHALQRPAPFGAWDARKRIDPGGGWVFRPSLYAAAWVLLALVLLFCGIRTGDIRRGIAPNPLWLGVAYAQIALAPLPLLKRTRPWVWLAALGLQMILFASGGGAAVPGVVALYLFTFDPAWVPRRLPGAVETLFYDGTCGLCHRAVRFVLAEDPDGAAFRFAPLQGDAFRAQVPEAERARLPDSLVLLTADGRVLTRSAGMRHLLARLGGIWRVLAAVGRIVPARLQDAAYDGIARIRHRLFARPKESCPILPPDLRERFTA